MSQNLDLAIVMPVYNEQAAIGAVLTKWTQALDRVGIAYEIHVYNDGSRDATFEILKRFAASNSKIVAHDKQNSGHGPTVLQGYNENCARAKWLFQIDSDDEMGPESFEKLWARRNQYDFLLGSRDGRNSPLVRRAISWVSRAQVRAFYGNGVYDVNSPYRLMRSESFKAVFALMPSNLLTPNLVLSGMASVKKMRIFEAPVPHQNRRTGTVSIRRWKLLKLSARAFFQNGICRLRFTFRRLDERSAQAPV